MSAFPKVSVVMPVYNSAKYVRQAVESILVQTFQDFEFIIIDDKSTDNTVEVIQSIQDTRIRLYTNKENLGRAGSDNAALAYVKGEYIAKMDGDDICSPERLAKQVNYLDANPSINVTGSWMQNFGASNYLNKYTADPEEAKCVGLFTLCVGNPTVMLRASLFKNDGMLYEASLWQSEDYDFFTRYINELSVSSIQEALVNYRVFPEGTKDKVLSNREAAAFKVQENLLRSWGIQFRAEELRCHQVLAHNNGPINFSVQKVYDWIQKILQYNIVNPWFNQQTLKRYLAFRWFLFCYAFVKRSNNLRQIYFESELSEFYDVPLIENLKFLVKSFR